MLKLESGIIRQGRFELRADLEIDAGRKYAVIGPSGAGKSTLLNALCGFVPLAAGRLTFEGRDITQANPGAGDVRRVQAAGAGVGRERLQRCRTHDARSQRILRERNKAVLRPGFARACRGEDRTVMRLARFTVPVRIRFDGPFDRLVIVGLAAAH